MVATLNWSQCHLGKQLWGEAPVLAFMTEANPRKPEPTDIFFPLECEARDDHDSWLACEPSRVRQVPKYRQWEPWRYAQGSDIGLSSRITSMSYHTQHSDDLIQSCQREIEAQMICFSPQVTKTSPDHIDLNGEGIQTNKRTNKQTVIFIFIC